MAVQSATRGGRLVRGLVTIAAHVRCSPCPRVGLHRAKRSLWSCRPFSAFSGGARSEFLPSDLLLDLSRFGRQLGAVAHDGDGSSGSGGDGGGGAAGSTVGGDGAPTGSAAPPPVSSGTDPDPNDEETLQVTNVDVLVDQNVNEHFTEEYDITDKDLKLNPNGCRLVVRRGQPFSIRIYLSRPYDPQVDDVRLVFRTGDNPDRRNGSLVKCALSDKELSRDWGARLDQQSENSIDVKVFPPPGCIVGKWHFSVDVMKRKDDRNKSFRYTYKDPVYLLFNPWCAGDFFSVQRLPAVGMYSFTTLLCSSEDTVFMEDQGEREEYVLSESGRIWIGDVSFSKPWYFGQFSGDVLDCCIQLLEKCDLKVNDRSNPVLVVRTLSAMVNALDENGVLVGNWSGDYKGGKSPLSWTGSKAILEEYYKKKTPVKFGQCWVFSGVLTAVLRALGIPARSVTNFSSAHDTDGSITIDRIVNEDGEKVEGRDSVWNYHVWNEAWMTRPELPLGYSGWQACDATPQELSDGVYCCGPFPVRAVKEGEVQLAYDGPFIFAEVNADRVTWIRMDDGSLQKNRVDKTSVGKDISTKALLSDLREDLTPFYKHAEGSEEERIALLRAQQLTNSPIDEYLEEKTPEDVHFQLLIDRENAYMGSDFTLKVQSTNESTEPRTVRGRIMVKTMYYTGLVADPVTNFVLEDVELAPKTTKEVDVQVKERDYRNKLKDVCMLSFTVMARVKETGQIFTDTESACLRKPRLEIQGPTSAQLGEEFEVQLSFTNPLPSSLTGCYLEVESHGISSSRKKYNLKKIRPKGKFTYSLILKPVKKGKREVVVILNSKELEDINGTHKVYVSS